MAGGAGGGSSGGQSMLGGLMAGSSGKQGWQGVVDPLGILLKAPPKKQPFLTDQPDLPVEATPQDTDRVAFLRAFGVQG
jgi:hypothetical protein